MGAVRIPGLEIGDALGRGAYSVVYRARRGDTTYALKVPHVRGKWTRWVYREAVALARVRHTGLPAVYEVGEIDGLPYLLMELVEGETLADRVRPGPLPADEALDIACQLADALKAVHEVGLVHRDVKPGNVVLDVRGNAKLVDFGFAAPLGTGETRDAVGTRRYSAPEQYRSPDRIDGRADLYALGRVLFECLTGQATAESDAARVVVELAGAGVSPAISRIVAGLVADDPDDRYPDAVAVLGELHRVRAGGLPRGPLACEPSRLQGPLVGRDTELERFIRSWRDVEASGGRVMLVEGRRGSGKTRFMQACARRVREEGRGRSLECECREGDPPLAALRRIFEAYFASLRWLPPHERAAASAALRIAASGPLAALAAVIAPAFSELLEAGESSTSVVPEAFAEGAAELVVRLARQAGPLLLCFDDLQWMDPLSREALGAIVDRAGEAPLLVLAGARSENHGDALDLDALGHRRATRVQLGPLELRQSAALVAARLGVAAVDPAVVRRIVATADDSPVGVLEVLGAYLDGGALRLRDNVWTLDAASVERVVLPTGALAYLGRRVSELPSATRRVLDVAAILGTRFDDALLAQVVGIDARDASYALADGRRAGLLEVDGRRGHRFGHGSVREMLAGAMDEPTRRALHQRVAEHLAGQADLSADALYACAMHFAAGEPHAAPAAAYRVSRGAAEAALSRFDNETALRCFELARAAAVEAGIALDSAFLRQVGEASLRVGSLDESLAAFETALALAGDDPTRAAILGRLAWVRRARSEPDRAWEALDLAFKTLGAKMPVEGEADRGAAMPAGGSAAPEVLFELYHQHARLGAECGKPNRSLQGSMQVLALAGGSGPSLALARAHATYGAVLVFARRPAAGEHHLAKAQAMAASLADPGAMAFCLQRRAVAFAFAGQFDAALKACVKCADEYAPWLEVVEFCNIIVNGDIIESVRGRASEAWSWIVRATDRLRRRNVASSVFASYILCRARAALATLGRTPEGPWLSAQLRSASTSPPEGALYRILSWGPLARYLLDSGSLGGPLEDLIRAFRAEKYDPKAAHPALHEYYVAIAHARIHQCLRATSGDRGHHVAALSQAAADLRATAKDPLVASHSLLADGALAWLEGKGPAARRLLAKAETLAERETSPWVLGGVARLKAHMLLEQGKHEAARDQGRIAELLARTHGAEPRALAIREELSLPAPELARHAPSSAASSGHGGAKRVRRQLASLLHIVRAPSSQIDLPQQGAAVVNDLVRELSADRGFLVFDPTDDPRARICVGRSRLGEPLSRPTGWQEALLRTVGDVGEGADENSMPPPPPEGTQDRLRVLTGALYLNDRRVGVVCLERGSTDPAFSLDDRELLLVLSHQVPVVLELTRLLMDRDQLQASFQQMQKMEVIGHLAGSVAHDFSNMLQAIGVAVEGLRANLTLDADAREDIDLLVDGTQRARQLTTKLLAFSRQRPLPLASTQLNASIKSLDPMLRRLVTRTSTVTLETDLGDIEPVQTDVASFEQAIVNLAVNAADAMPGGGHLTIRTRNVVLGEDAVRRGSPAPGDYVLVEVADTGEGIAPADRDRIFEPFYTTKAVGKGTGLGLATVYAFVKKSGGHIEVSSEVGRGTEFRLYLPRAPATRPSRWPASTRPSGRPPGGAMILVVDDDASVREATRQQLQVEGYRVFTAEGSADALRFVERQGGEIALVILDVHMPGMSGAELGRRLADLHLPAKVLFVTGSANDALLEDTPVAPDRLLRKPFSGPDLIGHVKRLLSA